MAMKNWFKKSEEQRSSVSTIEQILLETYLSQDQLTKQQALSIPSVAASVNLIAGTIATLPIELFRLKNGKVETITDDMRLKLLNDETGDLLDAFQFKQALVRDYLLDGAGYAYINKQKNKVVSLHYVDSSNINVTTNTDPIYKQAQLLVNGKTYEPFEFIKLARNSKDGVTGSSVIEDNNDMLSIAYRTIKFEQLLLKTGGNKKGFIKSEQKLAEEAMNALKTAWNNLYKDNTDNVVILNSGLDFKEASMSSVEMQLNENKKQNSDEIAKIFGLSTGLFTGNISDDEYSNNVRTCFLPIIKALETQLNKELLLETEKDTHYFAVNMKELMKGNLLQRYQAYEIALKNGFMQWDEVRYQEDYEPYNLDFIKLGLQDVLFNPKTKEIYTPNTDKTTNLAMKGGDNTNEN